MLAKKSPGIILALICAFACASPAFGFGEKATSSSDAQTDVSSGAVWVTRPDGAQQCAPGSGQSLGDSAQELKKAGVRVLGSQKGNDKKLHAQMCGISSGHTNTFQIPKEDLPKAIVLGF